MKAFVFPGQGAQFSGMGKDLHEASELARSRFDEANDILGFDIANIMFQGTDELDRQSAVRDQDHANHEDTLRVVSPRPSHCAAGGFLA